MASGDPALHRGFFLDIAVLVAEIVAWFAILFTGHYPRSLFDFLEGVIAGITALAPTRCS